MRLISIAKTIQQRTALYINSQFLTTAIIKNNKALHLWLSLSVIKKQSYQLLPQCAFKPTAINGSTVQFTHTERANWQIPTTLQWRKKSQTHGHEDQAWQNSKSKTGMRKRNRKTGMKSVHPKQNVVSDVQWEGDACGMIAILQKTRRAPSCQTNREAGLERGHVLS